MDWTKLISQAEKELMKKMNILREDGSEVEQLQIVTGGKITGGGNWLVGLEIGTIFLCRPSNSKQPFLQEFEIVNKDGNAVYMVNDVNDTVNTWVDSHTFSQTFSLYSILTRDKEEDGNSFIL